MLQDFRFAIRQLRRTPVFAAVTILTFALGIGANAAVFSVMNAVVLRFLPVEAPDRLVILHTTKQPDQTLANRATTTPRCRSASSSSCVRTAACSPI